MQILPHVSARVLYVPCVPPDSARGSRRVHYGLISWQLLGHHVTTIFSTVDFFEDLDRSRYRESEMEIFPLPTEALGLHGFVTYSTKEIPDMQERMLTWRLWLWKRWSGKPRPGTLKHRRGRCPIPLVAYKAETKSLKGWRWRSVLVSRTKVRYTILEGFGISRRKGLTLLTFRQLFHCCIATYEAVTFRD